MHYFKLDKMLNEFKGLTNSQPGRRKTFMDVSGYPHYENVVSNILAFFFNDSEQHGFGNLWLNSLLSCVKGINQEDFHAFVDREVLTDSDKRIDLLITSDRCVICIENKIFADVYNDLNNYAQFARRKAEAEQREPINIVLSLYKHRNTASFYNITYSELFDAVRQRLGAYIGKSDSAWILYMRDFMTTIESLPKGSNGMSIDFERFYMQKYDLLTALDKEKAEVYKSFAKEIEIVQEIIGSCLRRDNSNMSCNIPFANWQSPGLMRRSFYTDFYIPDAQNTIFSVETSRYPCGWCISLFERDCKSEDISNWINNDSEWMNDNGLKRVEPPKHTQNALSGRHHVIYVLPVTDDRSDREGIADKVCALIKHIQTLKAVFLISDKNKPSL